MAFKKAVREQSRARVAIDGPAGSGKSMTALRLAMALAGPAGRVAAIDTEFGSLSKYAGHQFEGERPFDFCVDELREFQPDNYVHALTEAAAAGFDVIVIDSLSHAWTGAGGLLDQADQAGEKNRFGVWKNLTPQQRRLVDAMLGSPLHVVCTMRSKTAYELEDRTNAQGKTVKVPVKIGMAPEQRAGMEYEFDLMGSMDQDNVITITKSRCPAMNRLASPKPTARFFAPFVAWLGMGAAPPNDEPPAAGPVTTPPPPAPPLSPKLVELKRLRELLNVSAEGWRTSLAKRGVQSATALTEEQQDEMIAALRARIQTNGQTLQEALQQQQDDSKS